MKRETAEVFTPLLLFCGFPDVEVPTEPILAIALDVRVGTVDDGFTNLSLVVEAFSAVSWALETGLVWCCQGLPL